MIQPVPTSLTHAGSSLPGASSLKRCFEAPPPKAWAALWNTWGAVGVRCERFRTPSVGLAGRVSLGHPSFWGCQALGWALLWGAQPLSCWLGCLRRDLCLFPAAGCDSSPEWGKAEGRTGSCGSQAQQRGKRQGDSGCDTALAANPAPSWTPECLYKFPIFPSTWAEPSRENTGEEERAGRALRVLPCLSTTVSRNPNYITLFSSDNEAFSSGQGPTEVVFLQKRKEHSCNFKLKHAITVLYCCQLEEICYTCLHTRIGAGRKQQIL